MKAFERMTGAPKTVTPDDSIRRAAALMAEFDIGALPVCDDGKLLGIVTDRDITIRSTALGSPPDSTNVSEVMTRAVRFLPEDSDIREVEQLMATARIRRVPIVDAEDRLVGIVSLGDLAVGAGREVSDVLQIVSQRSSGSELVSKRVDDDKDGLSWE